MGPSLEFATHYEPTPVADVEALLDAIPGDLSRFTFVDVGSGLGRVVLLAARRPFVRVLGIELSGSLHEVARENVASAVDPLRQCADIQLVRDDAATACVPAGDIVLFLYNPFGREVLEPFVRRALADETREIVVLYHTPVERETMLASGFAIVAEWQGASVFSRGGRGTVQNT